MPFKVWYFQNSPNEHFARLTQTLSMTVGNRERVANALRAVLDDLNLVSVCVRAYCE